MRKLFLMIIVLLLVPVTVFAAKKEKEVVEAISFDTFYNTVMNGEITKDFIEQQKLAYNQRTTFSVAKTTDTEITVFFDFFGTYEEKDEARETSVTKERATSGSFTIMYDMENQKAKSDYAVLKNEKMNPMIREIQKLIPLWMVESSSQYDKIKSYMDKDENIREHLSQYFQKCHMQKMHACVTDVTSYGDVVYTSEAELTDQPAKYVIGLLKEEAREKRTKQMMKYLSWVLVGLVFVYILAMACKEPVKKAKIGI